jgi:aminoglycoside/choline kinase family phosphotransferase
LVSLLRDCYISWQAELVTGLALEYREAAINAKLLDDSVEEEDYLRWFDWMGLQRHIKVLGIFARLNLRDGKPNYLKDLPLVIHYTLSVAESYPQLAEFSDWFRDRLMPLIEQQPWFSGYSDDEDEQ